jgi:glycerol-3-phosphate dehydrogenase
MVLSPKDYQDNWAALTPIQGKPNYEQLRPMHTTTLKANATSITSMCGGGTNRYIGRVVTAEAYKTIAAGTPFDHPPTPTIQPVIPAGTTVCHEWKACPTDKKTWSNFKKQFSTAEVVLQKEMDTEMAGYHGTNSVMSQENLQHQAEALANIATTIVSNHQAFDVLTNINLQLSMELLKKTEVLEAKT